MKEVEAQAHQFAAAFLLPADEIGSQLPATVDWPRLFELKRYWQVSLAALLMRARTLKRMDQATYLRAIKTASARGWRRVEPVPLGKPEQPTTLLAFVNSPLGRSTKDHIPHHIVSQIAEASASA
jgi:Zn-dependent peptidase ImmA (M78 family)